jgi:hypothetical protein
MLQATPNSGPLLYPLRRVYLAGEEGWNTRFIPTAGEGKHSVESRKILLAIGGEDGAES